jgi:hypothetical protein
MKKNNILCLGFLMAMIATSAHAADPATLNPAEVINGFKTMNGINNKVSDGQIKDISEVFDLKIGSKIKELRGQWAPFGSMIGIVQSLPSRIKSNDDLLAALKNTNTPSFTSPQTTSSEDKTLSDRCQVFQNDYKDVSVRPYWLNLTSVQNPKDSLPKALGMCFFDGDDNAVEAEPELSYSNNPLAQAADRVKEIERIKEMEKNALGELGEGANVKNDIDQPHDQSNNIINDQWLKQLKENIQNDPNPFAYPGMRPEPQIANNDNAVDNALDPYAQQNIVPDAQVAQNTDAQVAQQMDFASNLQPIPVQPIPDLAQDPKSAELFQDMGQICHKYFSSLP